MDKTISFKTNELVVGNHDSLTLFGSRAQCKLRDFSKAISEITVRGNNELEYIIDDVLEKIEKFQNHKEKKRVFGFLTSERKHQSNVIKEYNTLLVYIDNMALALRLQQAQLIKDTKVLEYLEKINIECCNELEICIINGMEILEGIKSDLYTNQDNDELKKWMVRLEKKIEDLRVSKIISLQNCEQIKMMRENDIQLTDKIMSIISGTIPIWRNQISLLLGIEKNNRNFKMQQEIADITNEYIDRSALEIQNVLKNKGNTIDLEKVIKANRNLINVLKELSVLEELDDSIKYKMNQNLYE